MKNLLFSLLTLVILLTSPATVDAAYKAPPDKRHAIPVYSDNRDLVRIHFVDLKNVKEISYVLSYESTGIPQGVIGKVEPNGKPYIRRDIELKTCSEGVCVVHENITNLMLEVRTTYKSGKTSTRIYIIRT